MDPYRNAEDVVSEILKLFDLRSGVSLKMRSAMVRAYVDGGLDAMRLYAYWHRGQQYVGTCGQTLDRAETEWIKGVIR